MLHQITLLRFFIGIVLSLFSYRLYLGLGIQRLDGALEFNEDGSLLPVSENRIYVKFVLPPYLAGISKHPLERKNADSL